MNYITNYQSPVGEIILVSDGRVLTGLWFKDQHFSGLELDEYALRDNLDIFSRTRQWLDLYFDGLTPEFMPAIRLEGTDFQKEVWKAMSEIEYGKTQTYGEIGELIAKRRGVEKMSAQAIGNAVGKNPVSILIPCHRVIRKGGKPGGYTGGVEKKIWLLEFEQENSSKDQKIR